MYDLPTSTMPYISCFLMSVSEKLSLAFYVQLDYWSVCIWFFFQTSFILLILTFSLSSLIWPSMYYFQYMCTVSRACVCEATAFATNEATVQLSTLALTKWGIDGIWYIWYSKLPLSVVPYGNYDHQKMNIPHRFNNWFTSWHKTLVIGMISTWRHHRIS